MTFTIQNTPLENLMIISPEVFGDDRGFFLESYNKQEFEKLGISTIFSQDNHSKSSKGTLRGLHFQAKFPQTKLVRVVSGKVFDVVVDIRKESNTFGKWFSLILSAENKLQLFIPIGFAHGFLTLEDDTQFLYKVDNYYFPQYESGIIWNDSNLNINWPLEEYGIITPSLSTKDKNLPDFLSFNINNPF